MTTIDEVWQMIQDCENRESKLTEWEVDFIADITEKVEYGLTEKQIEKLESIWERVTA